MIHSVSKTGAMSELLVSNHFLNLGFEVFRNVSPTGPVDLMVMNPETMEVIPVDIKTRNGNSKAGDSYRYWNNGPTPSEDVYVLYYAPDINYLWWHSHHGVPSALSAACIPSEPPERRPKDV